MLELKLFDGLEPRLQVGAAEVLSGKGGDAVAALGYLMHGCMLAVVGIDSGAAVATYGLPAFMRENGSLLNRDYGFMAAWSEGRGIATSMIASLERIFEEVAYRSEAPLVHRVASPGTLFRNLGYTAEGTFHDGVPVLSRTYTPNNSSLTLSEHAIVLNFVNRLASTS